MATKNYMINDKWLDLDKQNIVELQSVDGVLDHLKVNGSEIETPSGKITITENGTDIDIAQYALADVNVEGGGGSSDFSTAEVQLTIPAGVTNVTVNGAFCFSMDGMDASMAVVTESGTYDMILYKGGGIVEFTLGTGRSVTVTGNAEDLGGDAYLITGDCTITIS